VDGVLEKPFQPFFRHCGGYRSPEAQESYWIPAFGGIPKTLYGAGSDGFFKSWFLLKATATHNPSQASLYNITITRQCLVIHTGSAGGFSHKMTAFAAGCGELNP